MLNITAKPKMDLQNLNYQTAKVLLLIYQWRFTLLRQIPMFKIILVDMRYNEAQLYTAWKKLITEKTL